MNTIASLNEEIHRIESLGDNPNDLQDQRDLMTDKLSQIVNIQVTRTDGYSVSMGSINLVNGSEAVPLTAAALNTAFQSGDLNNGEVFGMITSRDVNVAGYQRQLDTLANTLANGDINVTIPAGILLPGTTTPLRLIQR